MTVSLIPLKPQKNDHGLKVGLDVNDFITATLKHPETLVKFHDEK